MAARILCPRPPFLAYGAGQQLASVGSPPDGAITAPMLAALSDRDRTAWMEMSTRSGIERARDFIAYFVGRSRGRRGRIRDRREQAARGLLEVGIQAPPHPLSEIATAAG